MVTDLDDLKELGKEMEQISEENDEDKLNQSHDEMFILTLIMNNNLFDSNKLAFISLLEFFLNLLILVLNFHLL